MANGLVSRMESFLLSLPQNPVSVDRAEVQEILRRLRRLKERPLLPDVAIAQRVGLVVTWVVGPVRARVIGREAKAAGVISESEREAFNLGITAATFFPPPLGMTPSPFRDLERVAEQALGLKRPRVG